MGIRQRVRREGVKACLARRVIGNVKRRCSSVEGWWMLINVLSDYNFAKRHAWIIEEK